MSQVIGFERVGDIVVLSAQNPPVNALGVDVRRGLLSGIEHAEAEGARAQLGLMEQSVPVVQDYVASSAPVYVSADQLTFLPRPGELR